MNALANFQELARQEAIEFQLEQKLERFERERSDSILQNIQASYAFIKLVGEVSNLYFPVMLDILLGISPENSVMDYSAASDEDTGKDLGNGPKKPQHPLDNPLLGPGDPGKI